jgi:hypothetical protein
MPPKEMMERVSKVESERMNLSDEERVAILKVSEDPEHAAAVMTPLRSGHRDRFAYREARQSPHVSALCG